ncbi:hypothetical protein ACF0H5_003015 [Mactra antiquata]
MANDGLFKSKDAGIHAEQKSKAGMYFVHVEGGVEMVTYIKTILILRPVYHED